MSKLTQLWGFHPQGVCVCVSASGLVSWEGRLGQERELQQQWRSSTLQGRSLPGGEVGGSRAFPPRSPLPLPWGRNQKWLVCERHWFQQSRGQNHRASALHYPQHLPCTPLQCECNVWLGRARARPKVEDKKVPWSDFYRPVMEFEIQHLDQCQGLVPDMDFLQKAADQGKDKIEKFMETQCGGHKCSFLAVNWNEDSKKGSGLLPYEIRMLPGSVETCGMKLKKIIMVMSSLYDKFFDDEAPQYLKATGIAAKLYQKSIGQENSTGTPWGRNGVELPKRFGGYGTISRRVPGLEFSHSSQAIPSKLIQITDTLGYSNVAMDRIW